jgi:hypothetical protein
VAPRVVFPMVQLFGADGHGAFEAAATLLLHWAGGWFEAFPAPPVTLLRRFMVRASPPGHGPEGTAQETAAREPFSTVLVCGPPTNLAAPSATFPRQLMLRHHDPQLGAHLLQPQLQARSTNPCAITEHDWHALAISLLDDRFDPAERQRRPPGLRC